MLENLDNKTYRIETLVKFEPAPNYFVTKKYVRNIEVYLLDKQIKNNAAYFLFHILVVDFIFSDPNNSQTILIEKISRIFDELELKVDVNGNIVQILNINAMRLRWHTIQTNICEHNKGIVLEQYLNEITQLLENEEKCIEFFESYNMFGLLFHGLWNTDENKNYQKNLKNKSTILMTPIKQGKKLRQKITTKPQEQSQKNSFEGFFDYHDNVFEEGFIEEESGKNKFKYSLLWIK